MADPCAVYVFAVLVDLVFGGVAPQKGHGALALVQIVALIGDAFAAVHEIEVGQNAVADDRAGVGVVVRAGQAAMGQNGVKAGLVEVEKTDVCLQRLRRAVAEVDVAFGKLVGVKDGAFHAQGGGDGGFDAVRLPQIGQETFIFLHRHRVRTVGEVVGRGAGDAAHGIGQIHPVGARRDEEQDAHGQREDGRAVFFAAAAEVFFRQHSGQAEDLIGQLAAAHVAALDRHVAALADGLDGGHLHGAPRGDDGREQDGQDGDG